MKKRFDWNQTFLLPVIASLVASYIFYIAAKDFWTSSVLIFAILATALISYMTGTFVLRFFLLANQTGVAKVYSDQASASTDIHNALKIASKVDILAVRGLGIASLKDSLVQTAARSSIVGKSIRIAYMAEDSVYAEVRAQELGESLAEFRNALKAGYTGITSLAKTPGMDVQLRVYHDAPTWRLIRADDTIFVSGFLKNHHGHEVAVHKITRSGDKSLFPIFERHFLEIWIKANPHDGVTYVRG